METRGDPGAVVPPSPLLPPAEPEVFELDAPFIPRRPPAAGPPPHSDGGPVRVLPYARQVPDRPRDADPEFPSLGRDLRLPIALLAIAVGLLIAVGLRWASLPVVMLVLGAFVCVKAVVAVVAVPLITRLAGVAFGRYARGVLKLAAVVLLPDATAAAVFTYADACSGLLLSIPAGVMVGWLLFRYTFDLDWSEAMWCTVILTVVTLVPYLLWFQLFWKILSIAG
jgi:hypothetical protein